MIGDLQRAAEVFHTLIRTYPNDYWSLAIKKYMEEANKELASLHESIAMYQQNERAYSIRETELCNQNDALRKTNMSLHTQILEARKYFGQDKLHDDLEALKEQVRKLGMDVQGLMNPVEVVRSTQAPDYGVEGTVHLHNVDRMTGERAYVIKFPDGYAVKITQHFED